MKNLFKKFIHKIKSHFAKIHIGVDYGFSKDESFFIKYKYVDGIMYVVDEGICARQ